MKIFLCLCALLVDASALSYNSASAGNNDFSDLVFVNRVFVPYGPDLTTTPPQPSDEVWEGYGFGMGANEHFAYDPYQGYVYTQSEQPYVAVLDYSKFPPSITQFSLDLSAYDSDIKDVAVCPEQGLLFIAATDADKILMYSTVQRNEPSRPSLLFEIDAGALPDNIRANPDCSILAVANENDGNALAEGAIHLVSNFRQNGGPTVRKITFGDFNDDYLLSRKVHMPLTEKAMEYWDENSDLADEIDWANVRADYNPGIFMQPEFMQFSHDGTQLFVNLQQNSALVRIDVASATARAIDGYGLKEWTSGAGIDIVDDGGCDLFVTSPVLYSNRKPDGIATVEIDGVDYVLTADEGSDADYGPYEEKMDAGDLFNGVTLGQRNFVASEAFFSTTNSSLGQTAPFNSNCGDNGLPWCADGLEITIGSDAVDYSDPMAPVVEKVVALGGRGIAIYRMPDSYDTEIDFIWDSKSEFEVEGCAQFPWSHSGVQDEDYAPINGARYELNPDERDGLDDMNDPNFDGCEDAGNGQPGACPISETIDEKALEDGLAPEAVTVAVACDRVFAISCGENNGDCFLYDISDINSGGNPVLRKVFNLSPASENKSPGVAYDDRTLGDLDAEVTRFVPANESPTGFPGIMFGGAHSGTLSFWEFQCENALEPVTSVFVGARGASEGGGGGGLSGGAIAGIVIGSVVGVLILGFVGYKVLRGRQSGGLEMDTGKANGGLS